MNPLQPLRDILRDKTTVTMVMEWALTLDLLRMATQGNPHAAKALVGRI